jgi:NADH:ubiquinone reductase (H+-translocating)
MNSLSQSCAAKPARPKVVIIGGGFAGLWAARRLKRVPVDVTLLDRGTSNLFQPLLYQCATGLLSEGQITQPLRSLLRDHRNATVVLGEAVGIDPDAKTVTARRVNGGSFELGYDYLIVAAGMRQSYFGHDEFAKHAPGMKTLDDALAIRRRVYGAFEIAESLPTAEERAEWLTFAVTGAGPAGVELAGQIRELATRALAREYRNIDPSEARVLLFDGLPSPVTAFGPRMSERASRQLTRLGVELHMGVLVTDVTEAGLTAKAKDGTLTNYRTRTVLWTAGVAAVPFATVLAKALDAVQDRAGRIGVLDDLTVPGHDRIWVVGDIMARDKPLPGVAEVAMQSGYHAAAQVDRKVRLQPARRNEAFRYHDLGSAAYISRYHAIVEFKGIRLSGFPGWLAWGVIHLAFLSGAWNRIRAISTWMVYLTRGRRSERAIPYGDPGAMPYPYSAITQQAES